MGRYFVEIAALFLQTARAGHLVPAFNHFPFRETLRDFAERKMVKRTVLELPWTR